MICGQGQNTVDIKQSEVREVKVGQAMAWETSERRIEQEQALDGEMEVTVSRLGEAQV